MYNFKILRGRTHGPPTSRRGRKWEGKRGEGEERREGSGNRGGCAMCFGGMDAPVSDEADRLCASIQELLLLLKRQTIIVQFITNLLTVLQDASVARKVNPWIWLNDKMT